MIFDEQRERETRSVSSLRIRGKQTFKTRTSNANEKREAFRVCEFAKNNQEGEQYVQTGINQSEFRGT